LADPVEQVALVAAARRDALLGVHRHRLGREDLEDCFSQATLELLARARAGRRFASSRHVANALEQRFLSRVLDRRRALSGRSPMQAALGGALAAGLDGAELADLRPGVEELVMLRFELRSVSSGALGLTHDQRLVLASQLLDVGCAEFCARFGWSSEKYRKVAQRGRARLRTLVNEAEGRCPGDGRSSDRCQEPRP
jgi:DNA-directed RNA polymerase specialized sigma24 family protein